MFSSIESLDTILRAFALSFLALTWVVIVVRVVGLRAFSKMTAFDFVVTLATGSLLASASQSTTWPQFFQSTLAIATLLGWQYGAARLRKSSPRVRGMLQNCPVLLMHDGVILQDALTATRVAESDLIAKLREANVKDFSEVRAAVLETTGDISILHGADVQDRLLSGVGTVG